MIIFYIRIYLQDYLTPRKHPDAPGTSVIHEAMKPPVQDSAVAIHNPFATQEDIISL